MNLKNLNRNDLVTPETRRDADGRTYAIGLVQNIIPSRNTSYTTG